MPVINRSSSTNNGIIWNTDNATEVSDKSSKLLTSSSFSSSSLGFLFSPSRWRPFSFLSSISSSFSFSTLIYSGSSSTRNNISSPLPVTTNTLPSSSSSSSSSSKVTLSYPHLYVDSNQWSIRTYMGLFFLFFLTLGIVIHTFWTPLVGSTKQRRIYVSPLSGLRIVEEYSNPCTIEELSRYRQVLYPYLRTHNPSFYYTDIDTVLPYLYYARSIYTRRFIHPPSKLTVSTPFSSFLLLPPVQDDLLSYPLIIQIGHMDRKIIQRILSLYLFTKEYNDTSTNDTVFFSTTSPSSIIPKVKKEWEYITISLSSSSNAALRLPSVSSSRTTSIFEFLFSSIDEFHRQQIIDKQWNTFVLNDHNDILSLDRWLVKQQYMQFPKVSFPDDTFLRIGNRHIHLLTLTSRQGLEPLILRNSSTLFAQGLVQFLLFEYTPYWRKNYKDPEYSLVNTISMLSSYNYVCFFLTIDGFLPLSNDYFRRVFTASSTDEEETVPYGHIFCGRQEDTDTIIIDSVKYNTKKLSEAVGDSAVSFLYSALLPSDTLSSRSFSQIGSLRSLVDHYNSKNTVRLPPFRWWTETLCSWSSLKYRHHDDI